MNNSEIIKGKSVKKYLDRALKNGWKIAKRIDFPNTDMYNYHLVPENESDGYICIWCKGKEFEAQYNKERYTDLYNYNGEKMYETGYDPTNPYTNEVFYEVVDADGENIMERFSAKDTTENEVFEYAQKLVNEQEERCCYDVYRVEKERLNDGRWHYVSDDFVKSFYNYD